MECAQPQTYTEVHAFLDIVGHYWRFIQGFACIAQPLNEHLTGAGASRKLEWVSLSEDALKAFKVLKQACMTAPVLPFTDYTKPFLLETDTSKDRLGAVLSQKQADGWYHPVAYGSRAPTKKWPFNKVWVFGAEMGGNRTFQGIPCSIDLSRERQTIIHLPT